MKSFFKLPTLKWITRITLCAVLASTSTSQAVSEGPEQKETCYTRSYEPRHFLIEKNKLQTFDRMWVSFYPGYGAQVHVYKRNENKKYSVILDQEKKIEGKKVVCDSFLMPESSGCMTYHFNHKGYVLVSPSNVTGKNPGVTLAYCAGRIIDSGECQDVKSNRIINKELQPWRAEDAADIGYLLKPVNCSDFENF